MIQAIREWQQSRAMMRLQIKMQAREKELTRKVHDLIELNTALSFQLDTIISEHAALKQKYFFRCKEVIQLKLKQGEMQCQNESQSTSTTCAIMNN
jgi:hypothetical protein